MRTILICMLALCATHCVRVDSRAITLPNGASGAVVHCSDIQDCYLQTQRICLSAYTVLKANDELADDFTGSRGLTEYVIQCAPLTPKTE